MAMRMAAVVLLGTLAVAGGQEGAGLPLAPSGGLQPGVARRPGPFLLHMAAVADMAYPRDFGTLHERRPPGPCLRRWGAVGEPVTVSAAAPSGGHAHALAFRTDEDVFVSFRGLDELANIWHIEADRARAYAAEYFGVNTTALQRRPPGQQQKQQQQQQMRRILGQGEEREEGQAPLRRQRERQRQERAQRRRHHHSAQGCAGAAAGEEGDFYVLRGFLSAYQALEPQLMSAVNRLATQMAPRAQETYRVWLVGHSDGSSLAQLSALRVAFTLGRDKLGGVFLFGAQRVGSEGFAGFYDCVAGGRTLRWHYGQDPAANQDDEGEGLRMVGRGFAACPEPGRPLEQLVEVPLGEDPRPVCGSAAAAAAAEGEQAAAAAALLEATGGRLRLAAAAARGRGRQAGPAVPGTGRLYMAALAARGDGAGAGNSSSGGAGNSSSGSGNGLLAVQYLAHHMPALFFDGLLRVLGGPVGNGTLAALAAPECAVSDKCAAALRRDAVGSRCATCAGAATCADWWGGSAGGSCDAAHPLWSGFLCFSSYFPPGLVGLLGLFGGREAPSKGGGGGLVAAR